MTSGVAAEGRPGTSRRKTHSAHTRRTNIAGIAGDRLSGASRFEAEVLAEPENLSALVDMPGKWGDTVRQQKPVREAVLDPDSSVSEAYGQQGGPACNGQFRSGFDDFACLRWCPDDSSDGRNGGRTRRRRRGYVRVGSERVWKHRSGRHRGRGPAEYACPPAEQALADAATPVRISRKADAGRRPQPIRNPPGNGTNKDAQ